MKRSTVFSVVWITGFLLIFGTKFPAEAANAKPQAGAGAAVDLNQVAGASGDVGRDGSFSHRVAIKLPRGRNEVHPDLALVYQSQAGNGFLGVGWVLDGLPAIVRMDWDQGVSYDGGDSYGFVGGFGAQPQGDGRLVPVGNQRYFQARHSDAEFSSHGQTMDGPTYWEMRDGQGNTYYFGGDGSSNAGATNQFNNHFHGIVPAPDPTQGIYAWLLVKVEDFYGNAYTVTYGSNTTWPFPSRFPTAIDYTRHPLDPGCNGTANQACRRVLFDYSSQRHDVTAPPGNFDQLLTDIIVTSKGQTVRSYQLHYEVSPSSGRNRLAWVQERGALGGTDLPRQSFFYSEASGPDDALRVWEGEEFQSFGDTQLLTGDVNGDGHDDLVYFFAPHHLDHFSGIGVQYVLGNDNGFETRVHEIDLSTANSRLNKMLYANYDKTDVRSRKPEVFLIDMSGDGRDDLVIVDIGSENKDGSGFRWPCFKNVTPYMRMSVLLSDDSGMGDPTASGSVVNKSMYWPTSTKHDQYPCDLQGYWQITYGDINGDMASDLVFADPTLVRLGYVLGGQGQYAIQLKYDSYEPTALPRWRSSDPIRYSNTGYMDWTDPRPLGLFVTDVDGDSRDDVVLGFSRDLPCLTQPYDFTQLDGILRLEIAKGQPGGLGPITTMQVSSGVLRMGDSNSKAINGFATKLRAGDIDGDGRADFTFGHHGNEAMTCNVYATELVTWFPNRSTVYPQIRNNMPQPTSAQGKKTKPDLLSGDVNGDGRTDFIYFYKGVSGVRIATYLASNQTAGALDGPYLHPVEDLSASFADSEFGPDRGWKAQLGDLNGDHIADLIVYYLRPDGWWVQYALGSAGPIDYDGDGQTDINCGLGPLQTHHGGSIPNAANPLQQAITLHLADANGDGKSDMIFSANGNRPITIMSTPGRPDLLRSVQNGIGGTTNVVYKPASHFAKAIDAEASYCGGENGYQTSSFCGNPDTSRRDLVWQLNQNNGRTGFWSKGRIKTFDYENGRLKPGVLSERRQLGFERVISWDEKTGRQLRRDYIQQTPLEGQVVKEADWGCVGDPNCKTPQKIRETHRSYVFEETHAAGIWWSGLSHEWSERFEGNRPYHRMDVYTDYDIRPYKRIIATESHAAGVLLRTDHQYYPVDTSRWLIGRIHQRYKSRPDILDSMGNPLILDLEVFTYDDSGGKPLQLKRHQKLLSEKPETLFCDEEAPVGETCQARIAEGVARMVTVAYDMTYNPFGGLEQVRDAKGRLTRTIYDPDWFAYAHRVINALSHNMFKNYDALGRLTHEADANGLVTETRYDQYGRPKAIIKPGDLLDGSTRFDYIDWGDPDRQHILAENWVTTSQSQKAFTYFDGMGETYLQGEETGLSDPAEIWTFQYWFYRNGQMVSRKSLPYSSSASSYPDVIETVEDHAGRTLAVHRLTGASATMVKTIRSTEYLWDGVSRTTDANQQQATTIKDARGRVTRFRDGLNQETRFEYDIFGNISDIYLPSGETDNHVQFTYDNWGRRLAMTDWATGTTTYTFDLAGNQLSVQNSMGQITSSCYDDLDRLLTVHTGTAVPCSSPARISYAYDAPGNLGRLNRVTFADGQISFNYDSRNRVAGKTYELWGAPDLKVDISFGYDFQDRIIWKIYDHGGPFERRLDFGRASNGLLQKVRLDGDTLASFGKYDAALRLGIKAFNNGVTTSYGYDAEGFLDALQSKNASGDVLQHLTYDFDAVGNVDAIVDHRVNTMHSGVATDESQHFDYDALNRLTQASGIYGQQSFGYDGMGNFTEKGGLDYVYSQQGGMRVIQGENQGARVWEVGHDSAGLRRYYEDFDKGLRYDYDYNAFQRLTEVYRDGDLRMTAGYDADGMRVVKTVYQDDGSETTTYYFDQDYEVRTNSHSAGKVARTLQITDGQGNRLATLTAGDALQGQPDTGEVYAVSGAMDGETSYGPPPGLWYHHPNHLGSASVMTDRSGKETSRYLYRPYGEVVKPSALTLQPAGSCGFNLTPHQFTGKEYDAAIELSYYGARYYDAITGRFLTADDRMVGEGADPQGFNRFAYALNNPLKYTDPSGHDPVLFYVTVLFAPTFAPMAGASGSLESAVRGLFFGDYSDRTPNARDKVVEKLKSPNYWRAVFLRTSLGEGTIENFPRLSKYAQHFRKMSWSSWADKLDTFFSPGFTFETTRYYRKAAVVMGLTSSEAGYGRILIKDGTEEMAKFLSFKRAFEKMGFVVDYAKGIADDVGVIIFHGVEREGVKIVGQVGLSRVASFAGAAMTAEVSAAIDIVGITYIELTNLSEFNREKIYSGTLCNFGDCTVAVPWDEWPHTWRSDTHQLWGRTFFRAPGHADFSAWNQFRDKYR